METNLKVMKTRQAVEPITFEPAITKPETHITAEPSTAPDVTAYAVGAGVAGLLVVGVLVAVIVMKMRARASHSRRNTSKEIKMNVDPGCTKRLTHNDEHGA